MATQSTKNTYQSGSARVLIYKEKGGFTAVCLDFDIVIHSDSYNHATETMSDLVFAYVKNASKYTLPVEALNRPASKKYWNKYYQYLETLRTQKRTSLLDVPRSTPIFGILSHPFTAKVALSS